MGPEVKVQLKTMQRPSSRFVGSTTFFGAIFLVVTYQAVQAFSLDGQIVFAIFNSLTVFTTLAFLFMSQYRFFGLVHVFLIYALVFFGIVPMIELRGLATYWGTSQTVFEYYGLTAALSYVGVLSFWITYVFGFRRAPNIKRKRLRTKPNPTILILASASVAFMIYLINGFSLSSVFYRGNVFGNRVALDQTTWLLFQYFVYPVPSLALIVYLYWSDRRAHFVMILALLVLVANPPTGMARFQAASLYIGILLAAVPALSQKRTLMFTLFFVGLFVLLPLLDLFRRLYVGSFTLTFESITTGTFDGFQLLATTISEGIVTFGYQLLGALFFFIPRVIWPTKPVSSGHYIASEMDLDWLNLSYSLLAEGYINFGFIGIFGFMIFTGYVCARYDRYFLAAPLLRTTASIYYLIFLGLFFFIMRGALQSGVGYSLGALCALIGVVTISTRRVYRHKKMRFSK